MGLCISGGKISARILKNAMMNFSGRWSGRRCKRNSRQPGEQEDGIAYQGKISLKELKRKNKDYSNIEITDQNIKSFEKYARKYEVEYSLKKDKSVNPPRYFVFLGQRMWIRSRRL